MDFTREPVIETIITPKEGCKIVLRNSKGIGQEEYFVDAVEVASFGNSLFFRSIEKPKAFLLPVSDYEILEVREARMVLKSVGAEKAIKIAGGKKETAKRVSAPPKPKKEEEGKRDKRRQTRRRKAPADSEQKSGLKSPQAPQKPAAGDKKSKPKPPPLPSDTEPQVSSLLPPPPSLISETIARYKGDETYKDAFFSETPEAAPEEPPE